MPADKLVQIRSELDSLSDATIAVNSQRFFKTGEGQYGAGDVFVGIRVPVLRRVAKEHRQLALSAVEELLRSTIHEERLLALLILVLQYASGTEQDRQSVFDCYCRNLAYVNNWDLVDSSAHLIVGPHLESRSKALLYRWAKSSVLWERRIAILSTLAYIRKDNFAEALRIADILITDPEDLIQKAVGWMLREVGKRDTVVEMEFLLPRYRKMPRTMLRYAIERFPVETRQRYLSGAMS